MAAVEGAPLLLKLVTMVLLEVRGEEADFVKVCSIIFLLTVTCPTPPPKGVSSKCLDINNI